MEIHSVLKCAALDRAVKLVINMVKMSGYNHVSNMV